MRWLTLILVFGAFVAPSAGTAQATLAVVVHAGSPVDDISLDELNKLFSGRTTRLGDKSNVSLYQHRGSREQFFEQAMNTTVGRASRAWIALVFSGDAAAPPVDFDRPAQVLDQVSARLGGIGFVPMADIEGSDVKILRIEGLAPGDPGYPLR